MQVLNIAQEKESLGVTLMRIVKWDNLVLLSFLLIISIKKFGIETRALCTPCYRNTLLLTVEMILAMKRQKYS